MKKIIIIMALTVISTTAQNVCGQNLRKTYQRVVKEGLERTSTLKKDTITEQDLNHLPELLRNYLKLTGVVGKEKVHNVRIVFKGRMRSNPEDPWMEFTSEQYNFFDHQIRAFYIKAKKMGIPANGLHLYQNEQAYMKIKLAGLFKIIDVDGAEMNQSETVTFLNDICFFAPAALVSMNNVNWQQLDSNQLKATYTINSQEISATLIFDSHGWLVNFRSNDRYELSNTKAISHPWYTPVNERGNFHGYTLPSKAGAWYKRPDKEFCYGEFITVDVQYNCNNKKDNHPPKTPNR